MHRTKLFVNNQPTYDLRPITLEYTQTGTNLSTLSNVNSPETATSEVGVELLCSQNQFYCLASHNHSSMVEQQHQVFTASFVQILTCAYIQFITHVNLTTTFVHSRLCTSANKWKCLDCMKNVGCFDNLDFILSTSLENFISKTFSHGIY